MKTFLLVAFLLLTVIVAPAQGSWTSAQGNANWSYPLGTGTSAPEYASGLFATAGSSVSSAAARGFLPYPPSGFGRVLLAAPVAPATANGRFSLNTVAASLTMSAASSGTVNKFSAYDIGGASEVAAMAFSISFNTAPTNGNFIFSIGNHGSAGNLYTNSSSVFRVTNELFTTLQWAYTATGINLNFRESANTTTATYRLISATAFAKGNTYQVEIYSNNSTVAQQYKRTGSSVASTLPAGKFHLWVNGSQLKYAGNADIATSNELPAGATLNSFLFQGSQNSTPFLNSAEITLQNLSLTFAQPPFSSSGTGPSVPDNWSTTSATSLTLSAEHFKDQDKRSVRWDPLGGDQLLVSNLAIPASEVGSATAGSAQIWVYSPAASNDTLVFQFLDQAGTVRREGRMLLNYQGWRDYHRSYRYDYNLGQESPAFVLQACRILYRGRPGAGQPVYLDAVKFIGDPQPRMPGPHMQLDFQHFPTPPAFSSSGNGLESWLNQPGLPLSPVTGEEVSGLQQVKTFYPRPLNAVTAADLLAAKNYVRGAGILRNPDNSIRGRGLLPLHNPDTLVLISRYCGILGRAYQRSGDAEARDLLLVFTEYLLDQGLAEGGRNLIPNNDYSSPDFAKGFFEALAVYPDGLRAEVVKMLKWSFEFNKIYAENPMPGHDLDYVYLKSAPLFELALAEPDPAIAARDLRYLSRFLEQTTEASQGARDGMKPDGTGFHHKVHHLSYLYSWATWADRAFSLKGTVFRISQRAYDNMAFAYQATFLQSSRGTLFSNSESGRTPFQASLPITASHFAKLVQVGGDLKGSPFDPDLAAVYNYIFHTDTYPVAKAGLDGYHHFNYAQLGVMRRKNWVATQKGLTNKLWGTEIYVNQNRYGRYQSYGSLEVLYDGSLEASGYVKLGDGWDWNVMPGTTTVHLPFTALEAQRDRADEYQVSNFAGALSLGRDGIFGMDFVQLANGNYSTSNLTFRKSVFSFDSVLVCLGSNIRTSNSLGNVATNLFQGISATANPAIYVNSLTPLTHADYQATLSTEEGPVWLVNGQTTGFYLPQGKGSLSIVRGAQTTPQQSSTDGSQVKTAQASKAYLNHGTQPAGAGYHYVVVPGTTPQSMAALAGKFSQNQVYTVLKQTDTLHAVKYLPTNTISYVFFRPQEQVQVGHVKSISGQALVGIREEADTLTVTVNTPDLNPVTTPATESYWKSSNSLVDLTLNGHWQVLDNPSGAGVAADAAALTASFTLIHGLSATLKLVKIKKEQAITFDSLAVSQVGAPNIPLAATSSSGLAVRYRSSDPQVAAITGDTLQVMGAGVATITAFQPGDGDYKPAPEVSRTFTVLKITQSISFDLLGDKLPGDADVELRASASSGLPLVYTSSDTTVALIRGSRLQILKAGTSLITAFQAGDARYAAADTSQVFTVLPLHLVVQSRNGDRDAANNVIKPELTILNQGNHDLAYGELTARYWLTAENYAGLRVWIDYAQLGSKQVEGQYVALAAPRQGALGYIEYRFDPAAGTLPAQGSSGPIQSRAANANWANLLETDDFSFRDHHVFTRNDQVTLYRNGVLVAGTEPARVAPAVQLRAWFQNGNKSTTKNAIRTLLRIENTGNQAIAYEDLRVRYWFSAEGDAALRFWLDFAQLGAGTVEGELQRLETPLAQADAYLELQVQPGTLHPLSSTGDIRYRISKADWSNFNEANDHSWRAAGPLEENDHITVYYRGQLVAGLEPGVAAARKDLSSGSTAPETGTGHLQVLPNPVADIMQLQFQAPAAGQAAIKVISLLGQVVLQQSTPVAAGLNLVPVPCTGLAPGEYLVVLTLGGRSERKIIIKR